MVTLLYSSEPHARQLSQFLVSDPNLRALFDDEDIATRDVIECFITLSEYVSHVSTIYLSH